MIKKIASLDTFLVRHPVLRAYKNIESCHFDGDNLETTKHFGFFDAEKLVGVASVFENININFIENKQLQLRGMAVLENYQNKGIGKKLVLNCENFAFHNQVELIWFNARLNAVSFYEKLGYSKFGKAFDILEVGKHFEMFKVFDIKKG